MKHLVEFNSGFDCIRFECVNQDSHCHPGSPGSHGRHGLSIRFVVKGDAGAVQFIIWTGWLPQFAVPSSIGVINVNDWTSGILMPADLGYHSKTPQYDGQNPIELACPYCDGQPCYYDGSSLNANDAMYTLVNGGGDALWTFLDAYYEAIFNDGPYPKVAEYPMPPRAGLTTEVDSRL